MKKIVFTTVLCFLVSLSFGQKKSVKAANNELGNTPPNFTEARSLIKDALTNPETANDAETWFVAGKIENKQFDDQRTLEILGKKPDEEVMYSALQKILPYFVKATELDQLPDAKGKVKPKFLKDIRSYVRANRPFYVNAGIYAYNQKSYQVAYDNFKTYNDIPGLDMFKDDKEKWNIAPKDTFEMQIQYYAGAAASSIPDHQAAIAMFEKIKNDGYVSNTLFTENELYQRLAGEYKLSEDTIAFANIIKEGVSKFPGEEYYVLNMINLSINSGKLDEAISYLEKAIAQSPDNAQLYDVLGQIYEADKKMDNAISNMNKAIEMDPNNIDFLSHIGRVYFNMGVEKRTESDNVSSDVAKSKEASNQSLDYFKQAMPFFEKVFGLDSQNSGAVFALRSIYYNLVSTDKSYNDKYDKMDALYNSLNSDKEK